MNTNITSARTNKIDELVEKLAQAMREELTRSIRTCMNCDHFDGPSETCRKYDNQRPPARVIASGCDGHEDIIPF